MFDYRQLRHLLQALSLSNKARQESTLGEIVNLMAVDAQIVSDAIWPLWNAVGAPVSVVISFTLLWEQMGGCSCVQ